MAFVESNLNFVFDVLTDVTVLPFKEFDGQRILVFDHLLLEITARVILIICESVCDLSKDCTR